MTMLEQVTRSLQGLLKQISFINRGITSGIRDHLILAIDYVKVMMNKSEKGLVLKITDLLGNEIKTEKVIHPNSNTINVSDLTNGIYFITLSGNEYSHTEKLVIQH